MFSGVDTNIIFVVNEPHVLNLKSHSKVCEKSLVSRCRLPYLWHAQFGCSHIHIAQMRADYRELIICLLTWNIVDSLYGLLFLWWFLNFYVAVISGAWQSLVTIECHCMGENSMNIMPNMYFSSHSGLERHDGEYRMTAHPFLSEQSVSLSC